MAVTTGTVKIDIKISGDSTADQALGAAEDSLVRIKGGAEGATGGLKQLGASFVTTANQAAQLVTQIVAAIERWREMALEGERARNATIAFEGSVQNATVALAAARQASGQLIEGTDLERFITQWDRMNLSLAKQTQLMQLSAVAAQERGITVKDATDRITKALLGETEGVKALGIKLKSTDDVLAVLQDKFGDSKLDQFETDVQRANVALADLISNLSKETVFAEELVGITGGLGISMVDFADRTDIASTALDGIAAAQVAASAAADRHTAALLAQANAWLKIADSIVKAQSAGVIEGDAINLSLRRRGGGRRRRPNFEQFADLGESGPSAAELGRGLLGSLASTAQTDRAGLELTRARAEARDRSTAAVDREIIALDKRTELARIEIELSHQIIGLGEARARRAQAEADAEIALMDVREAAQAREAELFDARISKFEEFTGSLQNAAASASASQDEVVAGLGRMLQALDANIGVIAKGGAGAIAASGKVAASFTKDKRAMAAIQGAFETAEAAASAARLDPFGAVAHGLAAGLFFAVAGSGGGSSAAAGGGASAGGAPARTARDLDTGRGREGALNVFFNGPVLMPGNEAQEAAVGLHKLLGQTGGTGMAN